VRARWLLISTVSLGCYHYPDEALLLALAREPEVIVFPNPQPKYLGFDDDRTAFIFEKLTRNGRYEAAPEESSLVCPGVPANGMHGYMLRLAVDSVMGDSAIATLFQSCVREVRKCPNGAETCIGTSGGTSLITTSYLLVRRDGQWNVAKPLTGAVRVSG
jgi:hypothetical protein